MFGNNHSRESGILVDISVIYIPFSRKNAGTFELCPDSKVLEGFEIKGGVERDGVLFVIKNEKAKEAETLVKSWLQKIKVAKAGKIQL